MLNSDENLFDVSNFDFWVTSPSVYKEFKKYSPKKERIPSEEEKFNEFLKSKLLESNKENLKCVSESLFSTCKSIFTSHLLTKVNQQYFLKLLANLSSEISVTDFINSTELHSWVKECSENDDPKVFLEAWKILQNIESTDNAVKYIYGVYPLIPPWKNQEDPVADVVLVHGIKGGAAYTWRQHDSCKIRPVLQQSQRRKLLSKNFEETSYQESLLNERYSWIWPLDWLSHSVSKPVRLIAIDYSSDSWYNEEDENRNCSLEELSSKIHKKLKAAGVGSRPIIWITHSMGGLIVKAIMKNESCRYNEELPCSSDIMSSTRAVIFFSVPHFGSPVASWACYLSPLVKPSRYIYDMKAGSSYLFHIHEVFSKLCEEKSIQVLTLNEAKPLPLTKNGPNVMFVPNKYGNPGIGQFYEIDASHLDVCKPTGRTDEKYRIIEEFIMRLPF
ncbi:Protein SERAC1 [Armadillidium nasatum]|uniref:Protein SERAC1 n=1 Tax=Armadillidium nasatum TaxID=96803 RepID=A0A5N5T0T0_9CRUS|nr:Protein SERAC1 [Armadillidium nasatum]